MRRDRDQKGEKSKRPGSEDRCVHIWRLRVRPGGARYWGVFIYPTVAAMNRWIESHSGRDRWSDQQKKGRPFAACCLTFEKGVPRNCLGVVIFNLEHIGAGIVAHEMTHASLRTIHQGYGRRLTRAAEEKLAQTAERLAREFWWRWHRYAS